MKTLASGSHVLICLLAGFAAGGVATGLAQAQEQQYLLLAKGNAFSEGFETAVQAAGGVVERKLSAIGVAVVRSAALDFITKAATIPELQAVAPDQRVTLSHDLKSAEVGSASGSPWKKKAPDLTGLQWAHQATHINEAHTLGFTGKGVRVVLMDGGIMTTHPDLVANLNLALSKSFVPGQGVEFVPGGYFDNFSHATFVAGIVASADNGFGTTGIAPEAELVLAKVGDDRDTSVQVSALIEALVYAADIDADVVNMSFNIFLHQTQWNTVAVTGLGRAAEYAYQQGVTMIAAASNDGFDGDHTWGHFIPRDLPHVISVSATTPIGWILDRTTDLDHFASYSNYGQSVIDLAAPGGDARSDLLPTWVTVDGISAPAYVFDMVVSTSSVYGPFDGRFEPTWNWADGTSAAAPCVTGIAALAIQAHGGSLTPDQVRTILQQSADDLGKPGNDDFYGAGRVNALRAVLQQ